MNLTEFLKYYKADKPTTFGAFVCSRRSEMGYSLRKFASKLGISAVYLGDIETGARPAPTKLLPLFIQELQVDEKEYKAFFDLADLSRTNWPQINEYLTKRPEAREFLKLAEQKKLPDEFFKQLSLIIEKRSPKTCENNQNTVVDDESESEKNNF